MNFALSNGESATGAVVVSPVRPEEFLVAAARLLDDGISHLAGRKASIGGSNLVRGFENETAQPPWEYLDLP
jgi:hypothetical protein